MNTSLLSRLSDLLPNHRLRICVLASLFLLLLQSAANPTSIFAAPQLDPEAAPKYTSSRYVGTTSYNVHLNWGYQLGDAVTAGTAPLNSVVVMDYGSPTWNGQNCINYCYGTGIFAPNGQRPFATTDAIAHAITGFMDGFWTNSPANARVTIVVGTNNAPLLNNNLDMYTHGQEWARMIKNLNLYIDDPTLPYRSKESVVGGNNIEVLYNTPTETREWVDGFAQFNAGTYTLFYYDFGNCPGCKNPPVSLSNGWTEDDVLYVAWLASPAWPLPEIYNTNGKNANQWEALNLYNVGAGRAKMAFRGSFTQYQACQQVAGTTHACPATTKNTPASGWTQLKTALDSDPRTSQSLRWSTDIMWQYP
jgi:hypothetical protein